MAVSHRLNERGVPSFIHSVRKQNAVVMNELLLTSGATDHKTHGSDHGSDFESRIGSFFGSAKKSCVNY